MLPISDDILLITCGAFVGLIVLNVGFCLYVIFSLHKATADRAKVHREVFGLLKQIEGYSASRREQVLRHYDRLIEMVSVRVPPVIAAHTSRVILETEKRVLTRLAELEPNLSNDAGAQKKMDDLILSMESLERSIVGLTSTTVQKIMLESRNEVLRGIDYDERSFAA